ncbi:MAG: hypothetical protein R3C49_07410 [Planctomycetaceae bacterium]
MFWVWANIQRDWGGVYFSSHRPVIGCRVTDSDVSARKRTVQPTAARTVNEPDDNHRKLFFYVIRQLLSEESVMKALFGFEIVVTMLFVVLAACFTDESFGW